MRVLALTNMYPPHYYGGYELLCRDVMVRFERAGHEASILTTDLRIDGVSDAEIDHHGGVHRSLRFYWDDHVLLRPRPWERLAIERHNQRVLRRRLDAFQPDVVSVWNMGAMSLGLIERMRRDGVPMVLNICDDWLVYGPELDAWTRLNRRAWLRPLSIAADRGLGAPVAPPSGATLGPACFISDFTRRRALGGSRWKCSPAPVVLSGIESSEFAPAPSRRAGWAWRLLYVGRLDDRKGILTLVDAMQLLSSEATLSVVGRGDPEFEQTLRDAVAERGLTNRVEFGVRDRQDLAVEYQAADVVVFPSEWDEPFGLVPIEAMACGTPVVATGTGGSAEFLVHRGNSLLYDAGDAQGLAAAVDELANDEELRDHCIAGGYRTASEMTTDRLAEVLEPWHCGAADDFAGGLPPDRPVVSDLLEG